MIDRDIVATIQKITLTEAGTGPLMFSMSGPNAASTGDPAKSQVAYTYLTAKFDHDEALNRGSDARLQASTKAKLATALGKLKSTFGGSRAIQVKNLMDDLEDRLFMGRPVQDTASSVKVRTALGFDEATWVKLMQNWDTYEPFVPGDIKAAALSDIESRALFLGSTELLKALKVLMKNPKKLRSLEKADQMRLRAIAQMLSSLKLDS